MTNDELQGRMTALEIISLTALGLYLANLPDDPDMARARGVLDRMRKMVGDRAATLPDGAAAAARSYGDDVLSAVLENMRLLRAG